MRWGTHAIGCRVDAGLQAPEVSAARERRARVTDPEPKDDTTADDRRGAFSAWVPGEAGVLARGVAQQARARLDRMRTSGRPAADPSVGAGTRQDAPAELPAAT